MKKLRELMQRRAAVAKEKGAELAAAGGLLDVASAASRDLTADERAAFDQHKANAEAKSNELERLQAQIDIEQDRLSAEAAANGTVFVPGSGSDVTVEDRKALNRRGGYHSFGEFAREVAQAAMTGSPSQRLAATPTTFGNESSGPDGGFAIPPEFSEEIWRLSLGDESLIPLTQNTEVAANSMIFPKDETTPWGGTGVQSYWQSEAKAAAESKPLLGTDTLVLNKLMTLVPVTNELIADGFAIGSYLSQVAPERIMWKVNEAILFGDGAGKPIGALNSPAVVVNPKTSGQATGTITNRNLADMVSRLLVGNLRNAIWLATPDILGPLEDMTVGNYPIYLPNQTAASAPYGLLKGRPLILSEHAAAFSSQSDISLLSLKGYRTITKAGGIQTATSMHLYFDADATAFRFIFRMNGKPILSKPVTPPTGKSTNTRSHFVTMAQR